MRYRNQKRLTISQNQLDYTIANLDKKPVSVIAKDLGVTYNIIRNNLKLMEIIKERNKDEKFFNIDSFGEHYRR